VFMTVGPDGQGIGPGDGMYEGFVTTDKVRFKVTSEPRFEAAEVAYTFKGSDNRVYLRPVMRPWIFAAHDEEGHIGDVRRAWASRLPIYPYRYQPPPGAGSLACLIRRSPLVDYPSLPPAYQSVQGTAIYSPLPAGSLVAAIAQGARVFYVWRKAARPANFTSLLGLGGIPNEIGECVV
jgi:hypothetical protein